MQIKRKSNKLKYLISSLIAIIFLLILVFWMQTLPTNNKKTNEINIQSGDNISKISRELKNKNIIKNDKIFNFYAKYKKAKTYPGKYLLSGGQNYNQIIKKLSTRPNEETYNITFYPGSGFNFNTNLSDKTPYHKQVFKKAGFSEKEINDIFNNPPDHVFIKRFDNLKNLEGLIYGDTFNVYKEDNIKQILKRNFNYYQKIIENNDLEKKYKKQGLTLYQGITLASIVERESHDKESKPIIAQIFLNRLKNDWPLGSDVTYHYANRLAGSSNDRLIDSAYNTRKNIGLPPTPIASPSKDSLVAVANPQKTEYMYFLAGDDGRIYYAKTEKEHNLNILKHCIKGCAVD